MSAWTHEDAARELYRVITTLIPLAWNHGEYHGETPTREAVENALVSLKNADDAFRNPTDPAAELSRLRACEAALRSLVEWWAVGTDLEADDVPPVFDAALTALKRRDV